MIGRMLLLFQYESRRAVVDHGLCPSACRGNRQSQSGKRQDPFAAGGDEGPFRGGPNVQDGVVIHALRPRSGKLVEKNLFRLTGRNLRYTSVIACPLPAGAIHGRRLS
jgi:hypothetical protein